ncbi:MAG: nucleoside 2-deoxyribosyltransferase [Solirubrobacteraceae bacterium]
MPRPRCYVASPLGFTEAGREYYARVYLPALAAVVEPVDPWALNEGGQNEGSAPADGERERALAIGRRNLEAIRSATLLAAYLDGQEPDSGTIAELGYAAGIGLRCFGLRTDLRQNGEPGVAVNLQVESFIVDSGGVIATSLDELVAALARSGGDG